MEWELQERARQGVWPLLAGQPFWPVSLSSPEPCGLGLDASLSGKLWPSCTFSSSQRKLGRSNRWGMRVGNFWRAQTCVLNSTAFWWKVCPTAVSKLIILFPGNNGLTRNLFIFIIIFFFMPACISLWWKTLFSGQLTNWNVSQNQVSAPLTFSFQIYYIPFNFVEVKKIMILSKQSS